MLNLVPVTVWRGKAPPDFVKLVGYDMAFDTEIDAGGNENYVIRRTDLDEAEEDFKTHEIFTALHNFFTEHPAVELVELLG